MPIGQHADVYIPPQPRKKDGDSQGPSQTSESRVLEEIPNAASIGLGQLTETHGDRLRLAIDSERCFVAITGSHIRVRPLCTGTRHPSN